MNTGMWECNCGQQTDPCSGPLLINRVEEWNKDVVEISEWLRQQKPELTRDELADLFIQCFIDAAGE
jgi:hypothetical protein